MTINLIPDKRTPPQPPHDLEAEQCVIGSVLLEPDKLALMDLSPDDFYLRRHTLIYAAMCYLTRAGGSLDYVTLAGRLSDTHQLAEVDSGGYIASLINAVPTAAHIESYAAKVKDAAQRRALIELAGTIAGDAYNMASDLDAGRGNWMQKLSNTATGREHTRQIGDFALELEREIDSAIANPREIYGLQTGFDDWDNITHGLHRGETTRLSGQPSMGKSLLVGQLALNLALAGHAGAFYELEMRGVAIVRRLLSGLTRILTHKIRGGFLSHDEQQALRRTLGQIAELPIYLSDETTWTTAKLSADLARRVAQDGIEWAIIDHDGLLADRAEDLLARDRMVSKAIQACAKDLNLAIISVHTMNKTGLRSQNPVLADASGGVNMVYDADNVAFLTEHMPQKGELKRENMRTLMYPKAREGEHNRYCHFMVLETDDARGFQRGLPRFEGTTREGY